MSSCPKCGHNIEADFGVLNCPSCNAMLSVGFDGEISLAEDMSVDPMVEPFSQSFDTSDVSVESSAEQSLEEMTFDNQNFSENQIPEFVEEVVEDPYIEQTTIKDEINSDVNSGSTNEPVNQTEDEEIRKISEDYFANDKEEQTKILNQSNLGDIAEFGNSELSSSKTGGILYDLHIEGIDTAEIKEELRLQLSDRKMLLDVKQIMSSIKQGSVTIKRLNPVKTALLVQRLRALDIEIQWIQHEVSRL